MSWRPRASCAAVLLAVLPLTAEGCGKKGSPRPPLRVRPAPVEALKVRQRGDSVVLTMQAPKARTDGSAFEEEVVLRLRLVPEAPVGLPSARGRRARQRGAAAENAAVSWVVPRDEWASYRVDKRLEISIPVASLELKAQSGAATLAGRKVTFVAEVQEGKRKRSLVAGPAALALCDPPAAPTGVETRLTAGGLLVWWDVSRDSSPAPPAPNVLLYRAEAGGAFGERPYRTLPPGTRSFLDETAAPGTAFRYQVRFGAGEDPSRCETEGSVETGAGFVDIFPPAPPAGLAAAAEESLIRLFWTPGAEPDIAGYMVYRSDSGDAPFVPLTSAPIAATTYADTAVKRGRRYTYVVSAVDTASPPNESRWSEPAEENLP